MTPEASAHTVDTVAGPGRLELTPGRGAGLLVLTHGSAGGVGAPDLLALAGAAHARGFDVAAITQPFRLAGRRQPGRPEQQDDAWAQLVRTALALVTTPDAPHRGPLVLAGRSNGARVACRTAAELGAAAVVCLAFPLHPPGRPENSRLAELDAPPCRVLVVQGANDPFGVPRSRRGRRKVVVVPGSDHALRGANAVVVREARALLRALAAPDDA